MPDDNSWGEPQEIPRDRFGNLIMPEMNPRPPMPSRSKPLRLLTADDSRDGKVLEKYCWAQFDHEVVIRVPIPDDVRKSKDVHVRYTERNIEVWLKKDNIPILKHELWNKIDVDESNWSLVPGETIDITLLKIDNIPEWKKDRSSEKWPVLTTDDTDHLSFPEPEENFPKSPGVMF